MIIRFAEDKDFEGWMNLLKLVSDNFPGLIIEDYKLFLNQSIKNQSALIYEDQNVVIGALAFSRGSKEIEFLAVNPEYRRKGIAKQLINFLFDQYPTDTRFTVVTYRNNDEKGAAARMLYENLGFKAGNLLKVFDYPCQELFYIKK